jgi:LPS-assembly protein
MKILLIILGILFTLTSEVYSKDYDSLGEDLSLSNQVKASEPSKLAKGTSSAKSSDKLPAWFWGNRKPLSPSEILYSEADFETPVEDWFWENGKPLTEDESVIIPGQLTFPNWINGTGAPITPPKKNTTEQADRKNILITSDHMTHDSKRDMVWAWGKVVIRFDDRTLRADNVKVNNKTGNGKAIGNVIITQKDGTRLHSQKSLFNMNNKQGRLFRTRGKIGKNHFIKGKEITRYSENHFKIKKGHVTTCSGSLPDWVFEAEDMDILKGDRALFSKGVFKVRGIPLLYIPVGYLPIATERKSGLLFPNFGQSNVDGVTLDNEYYWAINGHSDATFRLGYQGRRGFKPGIQYRYTPSPATRGSIDASYINDRLTRSTFWKINAFHKQELPDEFEFEGVLDLESQEFNRNFENNSADRSRRNSDSHATITKSWENSTLDILARYRDSSEQNSDQTFAELPQITYKVPKYVLGESDFYANLDTSFTSYLTDLDSTPDRDDNFTVQRFDFHPQLSRVMNIAPWLSFTPTLGVRETIYSKGLNASDNNKRLDAFTRESFDFTGRFEGPRIEKIYTLESKNVPKVKHLLEPRLTYSYIPDIDENDREKIKVLDGIDSVNRQSSISYSLTQRLLQKELEKDNTFSTREVLRFDISQSFNLIEATGEEKPEDKRPFSDLRFDLDSRLTDNFEFNADTTFDIYDSVFENWNFEIGIKPLDSLFLSVERRYVRRGDVFTIASADWAMKEGWRLQASTRIDELTATHRENHLTLVYDDPCRCWGFNFDLIKRNNFRAGGAGKNETKMFLGITFRGLGSIASGAQNILDLHRTFESIYDPIDPNDPNDPY